MKRVCSNSSMSVLPVTSRILFHSILPPFTKVNPPQAHREHENQHHLKSQIESKRIRSSSWANRHRDGRVVRNGQGNCVGAGTRGRSRRLLRHKEECAQHGFEEDKHIPTHTVIANNGKTSAYQQCDMGNTAEIFTLIEFTVKVHPP